MKVSIVEKDGKEYLRVRFGIIDMLVPMKKVIRAFREASFL